MFHTLAFYTAALASAAANTPLGVLTDQSFGQQNGRYQTPVDMRITAAYVAGDSLLNARVNTPSLRTISLPYIDPIATVLVNPGAGPVPLYGT